MIVRPYATRPPGADELHPPGEPRIAGPVLFERPGVQEIRQAVPDEEIGRRPDQEERRVQIRVLVLQNLVVRDEIGVGPFVQVVHAKDDRQKQNGQDRQHARGRADGTADHDAPGPARQLMDHAERQAPQRHAEHEHVRGQIRLEELSGGQPQPDERQQAARATGGQQPALVPPEIGDELVGRLCQRHYWSFPRSSAGTSSRVACMLSCSARM